MASALVPRLPAGVIDPAPVVVIQFICCDGPAWRTLPPDVAMNQPWLSERKTPPASAVYVGVAGTLVISRQLPVGDQISPILPPRAPDHEPPSTSAWPFDRSVMPWYPRPMFIRGPARQAFVTGL